MTHVSGYPFSFAMSASEIPVLPLVGSSSSRPGSSSPAASAASIIDFATRSLMEPVGFCPSSFAKMRAPPRGDRRFSSTSGVFPTRSRSDPAVIRLRATGHRRQQDDRRAVVHLGLEALQRPDVLAPNVHVHERRDLILFHELRPQPWETAHQVVEQLAHRRTGSVHLALAARPGP